MACVNNGGQITLILTNIIVGISMGGVILIAQYMGEGQKKDVSETVSTLITALLFIAIAVTFIMLFLKDPILRMMKVPEEAFQESSDYLLVTVIGIIFIFGYNALSSILRGMGDSKRPFYFLLISWLTNIDRKSVV